MEHISVKEWAQSHGISERTARNYCAQGKIPGAYLVGKTWSIPADAELYNKKIEKNISPLLIALREQKAGTSDERKNWFKVGDYKKLPNEVGGNDTTEPENVHKEIKALLKEYNAQKHPTLENIIDFHQRFEAIHPFQDGNGRVGRLDNFKIMLAKFRIKYNDVSATHSNS